MLKLEKFLSIGCISYVVLLQSCGIDTTEIVSQNNVVQVNNSIGDVITKQYDVYFETTIDNQNFTNPKENKYLGAYIENKVYNADIKLFEDDMGEHSMYLYDFNLNNFSQDELRKTINDCVINGAIPYIILTSNSVIYDMKIEDIELVNDVLQEYNYPIIVELLPYQYAHNYNVDLYKLFYIQAYEVLKQGNDKVDIAFPLDLRTLDESDVYKPSEIYFDYLAIRLDVDTKMTATKMMYLLDEAYQSYYTKPKIVNIGISHYDSDKNIYYSDEAIDKFEEIYTLMESGYENVVSVNYMDYYYDSNQPYPYNQRYTLTGIPDIAKEYRSLTSSSNFLKKMSFSYDDKCRTKLKEVAIKVDGEVYLNCKDFQYYGIDGKLVKINNEDYYELGQFIKEIEKRNYHLILDEENGKIVISENIS